MPQKCMCTRIDLEIAYMDICTHNTIQFELNMLPSRNNITYTLEKISNRIKLKNVLELL